MVAANTFGTDDVHYWTDFAQQVREHGPIGIYGRPTIAPYNHPPLSGLLLVAVGWLVDLGVAGLPFLIRVPAILADTVTALLLFELIRRFRSLNEAAAAGVLVVASPVMVIVSGFHGNTDPGEPARLSVLRGEAEPRGGPPGHGQYAPGIARAEPRGDRPASSPRQPRQGGAAVA